MKECKKYNRLIEKALYNELKNEEVEFFTEHSKLCKGCAKEFETFSKTLDLFKDRIIPKPDEEFMNNFWEAIEPKLKKESSSPIRQAIELINSLVSNSVWKYQIAGAAAILIIGIFIGEYLSSSEKASTQFSTPSGVKAAIEQTSIGIEAVNYIERSKVLMLGLMNFDTATDDIETISLSKQKEISRELLSKSYKLKDGLKNPSQQQLKKLITDIELILLQIANLDTKLDLSGIELIKDGVNTRGIILKINIQEMKESSLESNINAKMNRNINREI